MRQFLGLLVVGALCCATRTMAAEEQKDLRLTEAKTAYEDAKKLEVEGKYREAIAKGEHALALRQAVLGDKHLDVANCLNLLGNLYREDGKPAKSQPYYERAIAILKLLFGENDPRVARWLNNLAISYDQQGLYSQAQPIYERALAILESALGKNHSDVAYGLNNLGNNYEARGKYEQAEAMHARALAIREAALPKDHPLVASSLHNLANVYKEEGFYARAEVLYKRALAVWEAGLGKDHPEVALALTSLATLYSMEGSNAQAEQLFKRALQIREATIGKEHPDTAISLNNLADLYKTQGFYDRAEALFQRSLAIWEAALGPNHPVVATALNNLAIVYKEQGLYSRAEPLVQRGLAIREAAFGARHPDVAVSLDTLANVYAAQGQHDKAEPLYQRELAICEAMRDGGNRDIARVLTNLAELYEEQGSHERAGPLYQRALAIYEGAEGRIDPNIVYPLNGLGELRVAQHRLGDAMPLLARAFDISEQRLRQEALDFSESRLASFLLLLRADEERLYSLLRMYPDDASVRSLALTAALLLKGRSVDEAADISRTIYWSLGAQDREAFERLRGLRTQLATLSLESPGRLSVPDYQQRVKALADQGDALEADLAKRSAPLRALTTLPLPSDMIKRVAAALPSDSAFIELIAYEDRPLVPKPGATRSKIPGQLRYLALVLFPDTTTRAVDLGPAAPIDQAASQLRDALASRNAAVQVRAQALYQLAFRPLVPALGNTRRLFLSPDGQLGLIPFAALHDGHQFLIDTFDFTYLTSGKDLLARPDNTSPARSVVVLADPDFGASPAAPPPPAANVPALAERSYAVERFFSTPRAGVTDRSWAPLPGTREEAEAIHGLVPQAQLFLGADATKDRLLHLATPGVLHVATHGFFLEDASAPVGARAVAHFGALGEGTPAPLPPDPLLRSGLVLAGAHAVASGASDATKSELDNTLVTALELAGLNLWGTELVVLSACDTGRGDVKLGQGVYGLRRAFVVAGAETVVMSLWKVNDDTTRVLMDAYYRNLLAGQGRASALREAMLSLRATHPHPHFWAPFIALGRDTPVTAFTPMAPKHAEP